jgi:hypothetical protein
MDDIKYDPDELLRQHECLKRLLGQSHPRGPQDGKQDAFAAECDWAAQEALWFLDFAYLTGDDAPIRTAISLWNKAVDFRRFHRD